MAHYIISYKNLQMINEEENDFEGDKISDLEYNMTNKKSYIPYLLMDALEHHSGVSGDGEIKKYTLDDVDKALKDLNRVKRFLIETRKEMKKGDVYIFWG
jgi:hypothetical protein